MPDLLKSVEDGVMKLTFNRPDAMNALSRDMMSAFTQSLEEAAGSRDIGCVVVRGAGEKAFCAGGDVKSMAAGRDQEKTYEDKVHDIRIRMRVSELLHEMGKPTIAMVNGVAAGAGLSLALAADMRFVGKSARMTTPSPRSASRATSARTISCTSWSAPPRRASSTSPPRS